MEIQSLLEKLLDVNDSMSRCAASSAPTTLVTQKLARHRDILHEFTQKIIFFKTLTVLGQRKVVFDHQFLLG
ncbi:hypothetical protein DCAR_0311433 [Daucus carota subsp. sativus]|uniref:Uncharacterized protein n=1 Tax=Daucus carota subsp. sativus TaxID=79200 RepID=A0AAF1AR57_DAUCS|nr:hypothetical protein DCAR_0311433 [Daucus carota subsp. sativus]